MYALDYVMRKKIRIVLKRKIQHNIKKNQSHMAVKSIVVVIA